MGWVTYRAVCRSETTRFSGMLNVGVARSLQAPRFLSLTAIATDNGSLPTVTLTEKHLRHSEMVYPALRTCMYDNRPVIRFVLVLSA